MTYLPEITLGNLLMVISMLGSALGLWTKLNQQVMVMKKDLERLNERQNEQSEQIKSMSNMQSALSANQATLTAIMTERAHSHYNGPG